MAILASAGTVWSYSHVKALHLPYQEHIDSVYLGCLYAHVHMFMFIVPVILDCFKLSVTYYAMQRLNFKSYISSSPLLHWTKSSPWKIKLNLWAGISCRDNHNVARISLSHLKLIQSLVVKQGDDVVWFSFYLIVRLGPLGLLLLTYLVQLSAFHEATELVVDITKVWVRHFFY